MVTFSFSGKQNDTFIIVVKDSEVKLYLTFFLQNVRKDERRRIRKIFFFRVKNKYIELIS